MSLREKVIALLKTYQEELEFDHKNNKQGIEHSFFLSQRFNWVKDLIQELEENKTIPNT